MPIKYFFSSVRATLSSSVRATFLGMGAGFIALIVAFIITYLFLPHKGELTRIMGGTTMITMLIIAFGTYGLLPWVKTHAGG